MGRKPNRIFRIFNNVDLLAAQLTDNRLHPHPLHADAGTHRIHIAIPTLHRNLRPLTSLTRTRLDRDRAVVNLGNFLLEQPAHQVTIGARNHHAWPLRRLVHHLDHATHTIPGVERLQARLFPLRQPGFRLAQIHHQIHAFHALNRRVDQFPHPICVLPVNRIPLCFPDFLENNLLRRLRRNAPQGVRRLRDPDHSANIGSRINPLRFGQRHFQGRIDNHFSHRLHGVQLQTFFAAEIRFVVFVRLEVLPRRQQHGVLYGVKYDLSVNALLFTQDFNRLIYAVHVMPRFTV